MCMNANVWSLSELLRIYPIRAQFHVNKVEKKRNFAFCLSHPAKILLHYEGISFPMNYDLYPVNINMLEAQG
jgi:hypothetical protein